jgi:hypothetical protein
MSGWTKQQKAIIHIYKAAARLPDMDYRALLKSVADVASASDATLTNWHFDQVMAKIEAVLDYRIFEGFVKAPDAGKIRNLTYWRDRLPKDGQATSRHIHELYDWWYKLQPYIQPEQRDVKYLKSIIANACRCGITGNLTELRSWQAGLAIEAVKDRLRWALKSRAVEEAVPASEPMLGFLPEPEEVLEVEDPEADPSSLTPDDHEFIPEEVPF